MKNIETALETHRAAMLPAFEERTELTCELFHDIGNMLREDFSAVSRKKKRLKIVLDCVADVMEKMRQQDVKKQYAVDMLNVFLDTEIADYLRGQLGEETGRYIAAVISARGALRSSQWSDAHSRHWQRALDYVRL